MAERVYVGQLWRTQRGNVWQVSALYRPVVAEERVDAVPGMVYATRPVYGDQIAVMYCEQSGASHERHVPVSKLTGWRWNWTLVE